MSEQQPGWFTAGVHGKAYRTGTGGLVPGLLLLGLLAALFVLVLFGPEQDRAAILAFLRSPSLGTYSHAWTYVLLFPVSLVIGLFLILSHLNWRVILSDDGLRVRSWLGGTTFVPWESVAGLTHSRVDLAPPRRRRWFRLLPAWGQGPYQLSVTVPGVGGRLRQVRLGASPAGETPALRELREEILRRRSMKPDAGEGAPDAPGESLPAAAPPEGSPDATGKGAADESSPAEDKPGRGDAGDAGHAE